MPTSDKVPLQNRYRKIGKIFCDDFRCKSLICRLLTFKCLLVTQLLIIPLQREVIIPTVTELNKKRIWVRVHLRFCCWAGGADLRTGCHEACKRGWTGHKGTAGRLLQGIRHGNKGELVLQHLCRHQAAEEREPHLFLRQGGGEAEPADAGGRGTGADAEKITRKWGMVVIVCEKLLTFAETIIIQ